MSGLVAELMKLVDAKSDLRIDDAVATGANTVTVGSSTVPVLLPAIIPVTTGDFCQVLTQGPNRVILGPVYKTWQNITLNDANWTGTLQWRKEGDRVWMRGGILRTTSALPALNALFFTGVGANPKMSSQTVELPMLKFGASFTVTGAWRLTPASNMGTSTGSSVAVGDYVYFDHISWPLI